MAQRAFDVGTEPVGICHTAVLLGDVVPASLAVKMLPYLLLSSLLFACGGQSTKLDGTGSPPVEEDFVSEDAAPRPDGLDSMRLQESGGMEDDSLTGESTLVVPDSETPLDADPAGPEDDPTDVEAEDGDVGIPFGADDADALPPDADATLPDSQDADAPSDGTAEAPMSIDGIEIEVSPLGDQGIRVAFNTSLPAQTAIVVKNLSDGTSFEKAGPAGFDLEHSVQILGLKPVREYSLTIIAKSSNGLSVATSTVTHQTSTLPADMPPIAVTVNESGLSDSAFALVALMRWFGPGMGPAPLGVLAAVDPNGIIRWHLNLACTDFDFQEDGHLLCIEASKLIHEIDMFDGVVKTYDAEEMGLDTVHHAVHSLPNGNILTLSTELRPIEYPTPDGKTATYNVVGDVVVEFQPDGTVVSQWKLLDLLDPGYVPDPIGFNGPFWNVDYPKAEGGTKDWSHANSLSYNPADDTIIISLYLLDYVIKLKRSTGELVWRFGELGDFTLLTGSWPSHQHAAVTDADGVLRMFDNGLLKKPKGSRAVEYLIEPAETQDALGAAWQIWEFTDEQPFTSPTFGDVQLMPNGNVLIADASRMDDPLLPPWDINNGKFSRLLQVTHTSPAKLVHEMIIPDPAAESPYDYWVFKARPFKFE